MAKAFVSWSGGKDSCLAYYRALQKGMEVCSLFNMAREDGTRSRSHGLSKEVLNMQAQAVGLPLVQGQATWAGYEAEFEKALLALKEKGITDGVFGDIDLDVHRQWVEQVCRRAGIKPHLPLWEENQDKLMREFLGAGFRAVVVVTEAKMMGEEWLGREIDDVFMADLAACGNITPCGEAGEYHTLVIDGPSFSKSLMITEVEKVLKDDHWFLDIKKVELCQASGDRPE